MHNVPNLTIGDEVSIFHYSDAYNPVMTLKLEPAVVELEVRFN